MLVSQTGSSGLLQWQAFYNERLWFSCELNPEDLSVYSTSRAENAELLSKLFKTIKNLNNTFVPPTGLRFETALESNPEWGLGSSSTLISLLSQWAEVDPFKLNEIVFGGSGFDIACAKADGPILYVRSNLTEPISLNYPFADQLFLVYSGIKKKTSTEVSDFLKEKKISPQLIEEGSALTDEFSQCIDQDEFNLLIRQHEKLIGNITGRLPIKPEFFADFKGEIKSLGAWGGDFFLASTSLSFSAVKKYFENKGLTTVFRWDDLILKRR